ncbi:MAG TPA: selenocysteine-specific translation elongation factor [Acidimicrobiia bacterium]|nr:selenocysteine-specific translation elongation factor [Acidimicrobiia bacterium]
MPIVGTAGHVDHGKSTLIRAITGLDPDRWEEEKRRGLTIDLGFAWTTLPDGTEVGFVDVPGHERFIKNMLAGVGAVDVALFVVAADEGWMPQSEEHLAVLDLLGVTRGVVALTRADLVDGELLEFAELELRERLEGTSLEGAPVVATAAPEGRGIDEIAAAIGAALADVPPRAGDRTRMWIDRAFTIGGAGTVVTGTLLEGRIAVGDTLAILPQGIPVRVRGLQSHERSVEVALPGTRTAVNVVGVDRDEAERGSMLGRPGDWRTSRRFTAELRTVRTLAEPIRNRGAYRLHMGSGSWPARLRLLEGPELDGTGTAIVEPETAIPITAGDRLVLREVGRRAVVAGGRVLDPHPPRRGTDVRRSVEILLGAATPDAVAQALLDVRGVARGEDLTADSGGGRARRGLDAGAWIVSEGRQAEIGLAAVERTRAYQQANPLRPGVPKPDLATTLRIEPEILEAVVAASDDLVEQGAHVRTPDFIGTLDGSGEEAWAKAEETLRASGLAAPRRSELGLDREQLHVVVREGRLIEVSDEFVYLPDELERLVAAVRELGSGFTVAGFRDRFGISRKYAVPLLEWLDRTGVTRRDGDVRVLRA